MRTPNDEPAYIADEDTLLDLKVTRATLANLVVTDVVVATHSYDMICYTFIIANNGGWAPPPASSRKKILLEGTVLLKKPGQPRASETYAAGEQSGADASIGLPDPFSNFKAGGSIQTQSYCSNIKYGLSKDDYNSYVADGLLFFAVRLSGYQGWGEDNSPLVKLEPAPTTTAAAATATTQTPEGCTELNRPLLRSIFPARAISGTRITIRGNWMTGKVATRKYTQCCARLPPRLHYIYGGGLLRLWWRWFYFHSSFMIASFRKEAKSMTPPQKKMFIHTCMYIYIYYMILLKTIINMLLIIIIIIYYYFWVL